MSIKSRVAIINSVLNFSTPKAWCVLVQPMILYDYIGKKKEGKTLDHEVTITNYPVEVLVV